MNKEEENKFVQKSNEISEKMKNQALLWGSFISSIFCTLICIISRDNIIACSFYRASVFLYTCAFIALLMSHFSSSRAISAMCDRNRNMTRYYLTKVEKQTWTVFYFIFAGTVSSLIGLYMLTA